MRRSVLLVAIACSACEVEAPIVRLFEMQAVTVGEAHTCALSTAGTAFCWGNGRAGQLGTGAEQSSRFPQRVTGERTFTRIDAGARHTCAIAADGMAYCWGANESGQLGTGDLQASPAPRRVDSSERFTAISAGWGHTCAISVTGRGFCWGNNTNHELGSGVATAASNRPMAVAASLTFTQVSAGRRHSCALATGGVAYCWGANELGQLGIGGESGAVNAPARVDSDVVFTDISAGWNHSCGASATRLGLCWGENEYGELGGGWIAPAGFPAAVSPVEVANYGEIAFVQLSAGKSFTCATRDQGSAYCWGRGDHGQLGNGKLVQFPVPQWVIPGPDRTNVASADVFVRIEAGTAHVCGLSTSGTLFCWGNGADGQLGSGERLSMTARPVMESP